MSQSTWPVFHRGWNRAELWPDSLLSLDRFFRSSLPVFANFLSKRARAPWPMLSDFQRAYDIDSGPYVTSWAKSLG